MYVPERGGKAVQCIVLHCIAKQKEIERRRRKTERMEIYILVIVRINRRSLAKRHHCKVHVSVSLPVPALRVSIYVCGWVGEWK